MIDLGTLGGTCGVPNALNNRGQVVGLSDTAGDAAYHAFIWPGENNQMQDIGTLGGCCAIANWLNDAGAVVGGSYTSDGGFHAFLWKNGAMNELGPQGGCTEALGINSRNQVVGFTCPSNALGDAVLWENGQFIDLNYFNHSGSSLQQLVLAYNINDSGEIDGLGVPAGCVDPFSCGHTFVLIPCDDNHAGLDGCDYSSVEVPGPEVAPSVPHKTPVRQSSPRRWPQGNRFHLAGTTTAVRAQWGNADETAPNRQESCMTTERPAKDIPEDERIHGMGRCELNFGTDTYNGQCIEGARCIGGSSAAQCPPGKKGKTPTPVKCLTRGSVLLDAATHCTF